MDYKRKLKSRLYIAFVYIVIGTIMILGSFITKTENDFISSFGFAVVIMGVVRIRNYFVITRNEDSISKQEIAETDERNLFIIQKAKALFSPFIFSF